MGVHWRSFWYIPRLTMFEALVVSVVMLLGFSQPAGGEQAYRYRSYKAILEYYFDLERRYPELVKTWVAQDEWPEIHNGHSRELRCEGETCRTMVVRIANTKTLRPETPEVFISGALHGDERVGPTVATEIGGFLCENYAKRWDIRKLVDERATWIMPTTNAWGYAHNRRTELQLDPNRDFPYLQNPEKCMTTVTARAVNELFRRHLFRFMITFHGGTRVLSYEWGSKNHLSGRKSTECPDDAGQVGVAKVLQKVAGQSPSGQMFYPIGTMTDTVYWVDGGMEDWSYAASWEGSPNPINTCRPKTYGGYPEDRTRYHPDNIRTIVYLIEMDDRKTPREATLGHSNEMYRVDARDGHVSRNLRITLKTVELAEPDLVFVSDDGKEMPQEFPKTFVAGAGLAVSFHGFGCIEISAARLLLVPVEETLGDCRDLGPRFLDPKPREKLLGSALEVAKLLQTPSRCRGLALGWEPAVPALRLEGRVPQALSGADTKAAFCALLAAEFDQDWGKQNRPDPSVGPQTHLVKA